MLTGRLPRTIVLGISARTTWARQGWTRAGAHGRRVPAPEFSPRRVLKNYGDMTTSEFQSHLIKLDTTFRGDKALNTGKRPPNTEDEFVHLQSRALLQLRKQLQDDQLQTESLLVSRHRQLLMTDFVINESTVNCWWYNPEVHQKQPLDFFEAYGRARDERRTLISAARGKLPWQVAWQPWWPATRAWTSS